MFAVIRLRGTVDTDKKTERALQLLRLKAPNNCVIVPDTPSYRGMLQRVKDFIAYGELAQELLVEMLKKRGRLLGNVRLDDNTVKETGYETVESLAKSIFEGKLSLKDVPQLKPLFKLTPPAHGFKSTKLAYPQGDLGYRGDKINELIKRMI